MYNYELVPSIERKFKIGCPTVIKFFRSKFIYPPEVLGLWDESKDDIEDVFYDLNKSERGDSNLDISDELLNIQRILDKLTSIPVMKRNVKNFLSNN